jgi:hypothetical protein
MLTDAKIRSASSDGRRRRLSDRDGLYLELDPRGGKWWRFRYQFAGKEKMLSMGTYPDVSLKSAREKVIAARTLVSHGVDPSEARKAEKQSQVESATNSFEAIAREWYRTVHVPKVSEGHAERTLARLQNDVFPRIGKLRVDDIAAPAVLQTMRRIESRGAIETAHRVLQIVGQVFACVLAPRSSRCAKYHERTRPDHLPAHRGRLIRSCRPAGRSSSSRSGRRGASEHGDD